MNLPTLNGTRMHYVHYSNIHNLAITTGVRLRTLVQLRRLGRCIPTLRINSFSNNYTQAYQSTLFKTLSYASVRSVRKVPMHKQLLHIYQNSGIITLIQVISFFICRPQLFQLYQIFSLAINVVIICRGRFECHSSVKPPLCGVPNVTGHEVQRNCEIMKQWPSFTYSSLKKKFDF